MRNIFCSFICAGVILTTSCSEDRIKQRPDDIIPSTVRAEVFEKIKEQFPEHQDAKVVWDTLFQPTAQKQVVMSAESDLYVTFVSEGASYQNTFGWYSYTEGSKPSQASDLDLHVLFPTVSNGVLKQGDMLRVGDNKFPAGTVVGFFLIIKGWENGTINYGNETFYTDVEFNTDDQQQHVLFKQKDLGDIVLTFEDVLTSQPSDQDFNDIIFVVSDNANGASATKIDLGAVIEL